MKKYGKDSDRPVETVGDDARVESFSNPRPERPYEIEIVQKEFTSVCPKTGHPDFGCITIRYRPDGYCLELKSLKLYLQSYRNQGVFYETVINRILDDLVASCLPIEMEIIGDFSARGGITTRVMARYEKEG